MKKTTLLVLFGLLFCSLNLFAQERNCASMEVLDRLLQEDSGMKARMEAIERQTEEYLHGDQIRTRAVVTIPVVVHVVWRTSYPTENISDAQVLSQIDVLNKDFSALNSDISQVPSAFQGLIANSEVQFCMAQRDPNGNATNGINRVQSSRTSTWGTNDAVKKSSAGGVDPWDASKYLNVWVCAIGGGILGYAQFPGGSATTDGVVIDYRYYGTTGTATAPFNLGRTATHEVGHWLNLRHIWGDATCGNDFVNDTPVHNTANYGCPAQPHYSTCSGAPREMTMNYMDYTDDACMYMFSTGQAARMQAVLATGGARASLVNSDGCVPPGGGGGSCGTPASLSATAVTTNSATLNWGAVSGATLYNARLRQVGTTTWTTGSTSGTSIGATGLLSNTQYEFQVQADCNGTLGSFSASATFTTQSATACTDAYESNNSRSAAKVIPVGTTIQALISPSGDNDWFRFNNTSSQRNVRVTMTSLPADYDVILYRGSRQVGISENEGTADEQITYNNSRAATTYYVRVYGYNGANNASDCYDLTVFTSASSFRGEDGEIALEEIEEVAEPEVFIFPNPASDELTMDIPVESELPTQIAVFDMAGKVVLRATQALSKGNSITTLDVRQLPAGMYILKVQNGDFNSNQKFIISR